MSKKNDLKLLCQTLDSSLNIKTQNWRVLITLILYPFGLLLMPIMKNALKRHDHKNSKHFSLSASITVQKDKISVFCFFYLRNVMVSVDTLPTLKIVLKQVNASHK